MKRFLSIILAAVMVIALLPAAFAAADAETGNTVYKYEFTLSGAGEEGTAYDDDAYLGNITAVNAAVGMGNDAAEEGADWSYVGNRGFLADETTPGLLARLTTDGFWWYGATTSAKSFAGNGLVLKITVDDDGKYIPSVKYLPHHGLTGDLYAVIIDPSLTAVGGKTVDFENDARNSVYYVLNNKAWESLPEVQLAASGAMESKSGVPSSENIAELTGAALTLKKGEYYLLLAGGGLSSRYAPYINSFELEKLPVTKYEFTLGAMGATGTYTNSVTDTTNSHAEKGMGGGNWTYVGGHAYTTKVDNYYSQFTPYGFWYYSASSNGSLGTNGIVFEIDVPADGEYTTTLNYLPSYAGGTVYACIIDKAIDGRLHTNDYPYDFCDTISDTVTISGSAYYAETALKSSLTNGTDLRSEITLALSGELEYTNTAKVTDATIAEIKANDTVALKAGEYYLMIASDGTTTEHTTSSKYMPYINSFEIEKVGELDEALDAAFTVNKQDDYTYTAPTVESFTSDGESITVEKNEKGYYNITAPEQNTAGKSFLYWAKGLTAKKRIVSWTNAITNYVPDESGTNYLIAVYDSEGPAAENAEYYNANGQLIATGTQPANPSMAGYGSATGWKQYGDKNIWVAEYGNKTQPDDVIVTVNGKDETVPYGTSVTCTAEAVDGSGAPFKCWTKTDINGETEIVSIDTEYTFKAWEACTVTAVYEEHSFVSVVTKIILDSFDAGDETGIMAEFIGFDNKVVEKGIMFGDNRIAMTAPGSQFSVVADKNGTYKGYAIVKNTDGTYSLITDYGITVSDAE